METTSAEIQRLIFFAGMAQIALVLGSLAIPQILNWSAELGKVPTLIKQMFWTYAAYILVINLSFGLLSFFAHRDLTNGSVLATAINGFIATYWISRIGVQFFYFDRKSFPTGLANRIAEIMLIALFIFLTIVYALAFYHNYQQP